jgi:hypothetical protein
MTVQNPRAYEKLELYKLLRRVLRDPIVILMKGDWRTGKTDTSLLLGYLSQKWGLIDTIGSNIFTFDSPLVDYVITTGQLKEWLHKDKTRKLFLFDEGLKWVYRRKAMSSMNVSIITEILPEISKGHARMILLSQIDSLDSDIMHPAFTRAVFTKQTKKVMTTVAKHYPPRTFTHLPSVQSVIRFDPDRQADFFNREVSKVRDSSHMSLTWQICEAYTEGVRFNEIKRRFGIHQQQLKRHIQKGLKWFIQNYEDSGDSGQEIVNSPEKGAT